jgi:hypothetical protein
MGCLRGGGDFGHRPQGVGWRLDPDEAGLAGADGGLQGRRVVGLSAQQSAEELNRAQDASIASI